MSVNVFVLRKYIQMYVVVKKTLLTFQLVKEKFAYIKVFIYRENDKTNGQNVTRVKSKVENIRMY